VSAAAVGRDPGAGTALDLDAYLAAEVVRVEQAMAAVTAAIPATVPPAMREPMVYALGTRGKRIRPVLCATSFRAVHGDEPSDGVYQLGCALELVHTYSLVHDDLPCMDDDDLRRGRPTVHRVHGTPLAMLAGAALLPLAAGAVMEGGAALGLNVAERGRLLAELCRAAGAEGMVGGQFRDLEAETRPIDGRGLEAIHRAKTGALLAASLRIGALAARCDTRRLVALTEYGEALGLAFQIADDILDCTASSADLGKTAGKDENAGKATYPALFGLDGARVLARERAEQAVQALRRAGIASPPLEALARFVVERGR
jgi:geranylgeranyl diphosphate synthase, type II